VILDPVMKVIDGTVVLNCHPAGGYSISTSVPVLKSVNTPSVTTIGPSAVNPGLGPVTALLLHIVDPPGPGVTDTVARAAVIPQQIRTIRVNNFLVVSRNPVPDIRRSDLRKIPCSM
jgi:hypothetical protein